MDRNGDAPIPSSYTWTFPRFNFITESSVIILNSRLSGTT